jgi:uncharacterized protein (TIGR00369 family)
VIVENPLLTYLGVELANWEKGRCEFYLDVEPRHLNRQGSLQGGVIATLLDAACGYAGLKVDSDDAPEHAVTVMLSICYLNKVESGRICAIGRVTRAGHRMYFADAQLLRADNEIVATAQGTFKKNTSY